MTFGLVKTGYFFMHQLTFFLADPRASTTSSTIVVVP
ncbi:unnamed protein product, partial [Vitis vinifera]